MLTHCLDPCQTPQDAPVASLTFGKSGLLLYHLSHLSGSSGNHCTSMQLHGLSLLLAFPSGERYLPNPAFNLPGCWPCLSAALPVLCLSPPQWMLIITTLGFMPLVANCLIIQKLPPLWHLLVIQSFMAGPNCCPVTIRYVQSC